ncbi:DltE Short-chain dehydrogenases of various substrate specificities [actinobacterium SCGC AAA044-D11]
MTTALVTGATAGIGESFTRLLAAKGFDLVLVARDKKRLQERANSLSKKYSVEVEVLPADLSVPAQLAKVEKRLSNPKKPIEVLINNAGFGIKDSFLASNLADEIQLMDVLAKAPMQLMHAVLPQMLSRDSGTIINVSSVASFIAGGTYSAAKSYLTVHTESLHTELSKTKINISALCPGFTHTEFHQRGNMKMSGLPNFMWLEADRVVADSWRAALAGRAICIPGWQYKTLSTIARFGPRPLVRKLGIKVRARQR